MLLFPPVESGATVRDMPAHELFVGYFVSCAAGGLSFFEAVDSLKTLQEDPDSVPTREQ